MCALTTHPHSTYTQTRAANVELGRMTMMTSIFALDLNSLSSAIPTGECTRTNELHKLSAAAHETHTIASAPSLRGHQRDAREPSATAHHARAPDH